VCERKSERVRERLRPLSLLSTHFSCWLGGCWSDQVRVQLKSATFTTFELVLKPLSLFIYLFIYLLFKHFFSKVKERKEKKTISPSNAIVCFFFERNRIIFRFNSASNCFLWFSMTEELLLQRSHIYYLYNQYLAELMLFPRHKYLILII
jgi:hypothetical protein